MRFKQLGDWQMLAQDRSLSMQLSDDFVRFRSTPRCFGLTLPAAPSDMQAQSQSQVKSESFILKAWLDLDVNFFFTIRWE